MVRIAIGGMVLMLTVLATFASATTHAQDNGELELDQRTTTWNDLSNEDSYRVSGHILYQEEASCGPDRLSLGSERIEFDEILPANTTFFGFPEPSDPRLTWAKDGVYTLEAFAADGSRIDIEGFAWIADQFCTPEDIAAELAAAGTGYSPPDSRVLMYAMAALLTFGVASLVAGAAARRAGA